MALEYKNGHSKSQIAISKLVLPTLAALLLLAAGCRRDKVEVYQVTSDQDQVQQAASGPATNSNTLPPDHPDISMTGDSSAQMPSGVVPSDVQNAPPITWATPPGWTSVPPGEMRVASFKIAGPGGQSADVSVVPLSGMGGGDFANVNRWRGQVGLQAAPDDQLQNSAENVEAGGQSASLYDLAGQSSSSGRPTRILGAIQHRDGTAWFFKMTGDAALVEQQKPAFIAFLKSLDFESQQAQQAQPQLPPGHPDVNGMTAASPAGSSSSQPNWTVPSAWQPLPAGQFLVAKFEINGNAGTTADVNVSSSAGDGGGLAANVNRWRGQLGLPPVDEVPTVTFAVPGGQAQLVDLSGNDPQTGKPSEIVAVVVALQGQTWFYKLVGDPSVVGLQKNAFTEFVKSVQY
ncbi:MAG TPA: hypothetical protein VME24_13160 [Alphaproteobacteria bacterium]|nr:hypothetical protein [Alphaproteobacteria bacterium]